MRSKLKRKNYGNRIRMMIGVNGYYGTGREHIGWYEWKPRTRAEIINILVNAGNAAPYHEDRKFTLVATSMCTDASEHPSIDITDLLTEINLE